ncbi:GNAT family N-acetyltransferase [Bacillus sp. T33-2]|uniref:GNAT family N-acetyltransferase n=1 Tax=Bacillus sp. T33-2 TaxID=2054168 RepID=UPI000C777192|nr:GNAT family N-acetyltransferase [Bacillus sp. T33-2]PLR94128.1 GNAT family N-acetyltransferase [Bacillus sp. T33-2]
MKTKSRNDVMISFYDPRFDAELRAFQLPEEQQKFTGMPDKSLETASADPNRFPIVILSSDIPVGFFILHKGTDIKPFTQNPRAMLLRAFSINHKHQGRGYAKQALLQLPDFVSMHFPEIDEIVLAVNEKNIAAKQLYEKSGFQDLGERRTGPIGMQYILQYPLNK